MRVETKLKSARVIIPGPGNRQAGIKRMVHCHSTQSACHRPSFLDFLHFCGTCRIHSPSIHCFRLLRPCPTHKADGLAPPRRTPKNTRSRRHGDGRPLPASTVADCVSTLPLLLPSPRAALSLSLSLFWRRLGDHCRRSTPGRQVLVGPSPATSTHQVFPPLLFTSCRAKPINQSLTSFICIRRIRFSD
jgi:hypothetical protein